MANNHTYLNEQKYQQNKKKLTVAAGIVLACGLLLGCGLIIGGIISQNSLPDQGQQADDFLSGKVSFGEMSRADDAKFGAITMIIGGALISIVSVMISVAIFSFAKRREILAFQAQQIAPVAKETIQTFTPTIANTAGTVAQSISEGWRRGQTPTTPPSPSAASTPDPTKNDFNPPAEPSSTSAPQQ